MFRQSVDKATNLKQRQMTKGEKRITIKDIARIAGVSMGTVDRVIHNRGDVSPRNRQRIMEVIEEIGYKPNIYASMLALNKHYHIYCLVPKMLDGEYWGLARNGILRAGEENEQNNISIHVIEFDQFDVSSFHNACNELLAAEVHGVVLAPVFRDEALALSRQLYAKEIPFIYVDTKANDDDYLAYYGMPMYESGLLAAALLTKEHPKEILCIGLERWNSPSDNATERRKEGFMTYLSDHFPQTVVYNELMHPYNKSHNIELLNSFFKKHPGVRHVITFNSRIYLVAEYLEQLGLEGYGLVGFDMLERNVAALKKGYIQYLVVQHTETQLLQGINTLVGLLVFNLLPEEKDNYMPMDVILKENVDFYKDILNSHRKM